MASTKHGFALAIKQCMSIATVQWRAVQSKTYILGYEKGTPPLESSHDTIKY